MKQEQFGFRPQSGTREAIFRMRMMTERYITVNTEYVDVTVLCAENEADLQHVFDIVKVNSKEFGLCMNVKKTRSMIILVEQRISLESAWNSMDISLSRSVITSTLQDKILKMMPDAKQK